MIYIREKKDNLYIFLLFHIISRPSYLTCCRGSQLALLHRVKERKNPSLSAQASFAPFSLKVAWSGKWGRVGATKGERDGGRGSSFSPANRGQGGKSFSHAERGRDTTGCRPLFAGG